VGRVSRPIRGADERALDSRHTTQGIDMPVVVQDTEAALGCGRCDQIVGGS
jgi:hypothetical protein